ncbi:MAG: ABC transporter permease [TACK group archaeon]|nr:ABC transporter permease [TACK group archaeon]
MSNFLRLLEYMTWRRFIELTRYRANLVAGITSPLIWSAAFFLLVPFYSRSGMSSVIGTSNYGAYLVLGLSMISFQSIALWSGANNFTWELTTGLIDYSFSSPISKYAYIEAVIVSDAVLSLIVYDSPFLAVAFLLSARTLSLPGFAYGMIAYGLTIVALSEIGVAFSALTLLYKNVSNVFEFINMAFQFLTGMIIPLQVLPDFVRDASVFIPLTFGIDLSRHYVLLSSTIFPIDMEWLGLGLQLASLLLASTLIFRFVERKARRNGFHYV